VVDLTRTMGRHLTDTRGRSELWDRLLTRRERRRLAKSRSGSHPISHVDPDKCYEWMRSECAALDLARQGREDGLIATVTQISSAALLAIPGLLLGSERAFPRMAEAPLLFAGLLLFVIALGLAMLEQFLSGKAYRKQVTIVQKYYLQESEERYDTSFVAWVRRTRNGACLSFAFAVLVSATGLISFDRSQNGHSPVSATPSSSSAATTTTAAPSSATTATTATTPSAAAAATTAPPTSGRLRIQRMDSSVRSGVNSAAAHEKVGD